VELVLEDAVSVFNTDADAGEVPVEEALGDLLAGPDAAALVRCDQPSEVLRVAHIGEDPLVGVVQELVPVGAQRALIEDGLVVLVPIR